MRYRILGVTQAEDDHGTVVPLGGPRVRALLTALALRPGHPLAPDTLIDDIWADDPPQDANAALQALVGRLRRAIGRTTIVSTPGGYRLEATRTDVDLFVFEHLVHQGTEALRTGDPGAAARALDEALALWHGPALADLPDRTAATRPETLRLEATRTRAEASLRLGRAQDAVPELTELTAAHPYDEKLHALLVRALRDTGRPADALAAYETARRALSEGLGTDPGPELRALHAELLAPPPPTAGPVPPPPTPGPIPPPSHPTRTGNIRPRLNSFVGREPELDAIRSELHRARLVTLTGPGGSGKTRLAEEAAAGLPQAWLVELAPLDRPEAVPGAVVSALGLRQTVLMATELSTPQEDPLTLLVEYCAPRSQLLILDNCEHVIEATAHLAETLLTHCPGLTILATSREPLGVPGESVRPVEPLLPDQAHRLFTERATAVRPDAADLVLRDSAAVAEICRRLDGLPLAIELAAARLRLLTPRQIADRLDDRFRLLTSGSRTVLPRQQTLRAVVDWSWDLLDERERTVLREASVFAGGWDLAAAEAVCTGPAAELIGALVDKSLIVAAPSEAPDSGGAMRYRMLETIHEYAVERAAEAPEQRADAERRHRAWAGALVAEAEPVLRSVGQLPWISRLETELDNIRAALHRAVEDGDEAAAGALALHMGWFWWLRNYRREGADWVDRILRLGAALDTTSPANPAAAAPSLTADPAAVAPSLTAGPVAAPSLPADPRARCSLMEAMDPVEALLSAPDGEAGHPLHALRMELRMLHVLLVSELEARTREPDERLGRYIAQVRAYFEKGGPQAARMPGLVWPLTSFFMGDRVDARSVLDSAVANCRKYGGDWELGVTLMFRTHMVVDSPGGMQGVDDDLAELRLLSRRVGDRWLRAQVYSAAGETAMARGRLEEAKGEYEEALQLAYEVGAYTETPFLIARLAEIAYRAGDRSAAITALEEASEAADRYSVGDSRAFVLLLRAHVALDDKDTATARELLEEARGETARGTPPPQFIVMLNSVEAMVTVAESGPEHGLPKLVATVREAVDKQCADLIVATLVDATAALLADLGDLPRAARLLAAAGHWRGDDARSQPEAARAERAESAARTGLGPARHEAEHARGVTLTPAGVLDELDEALRAGVTGR
ncbi:BTAD domain-containing putative transcriptional regulator [Streptomyces justiciae]|uniref:BTAD domain-containing putative transcriptional regulator n=1 Tax=Streptomyces justiciae TaxID=2780140 RepID=UPI002AD2E0F5|nr:BTAD domain-containing putative transcriptional regulator [Streptomyces justiciae]